MQKVLQSVLLIIVASACSTNRLNNDLSKLIVLGAYNVHQVQLEHPAVTQLSYDVDIPYPGVAISAEKLESLKQQGWHSCPQHKDKWEHFGDRTVEPPKVVHQSLKRFAKKGAFMVIAMRYLSALPSLDPTESKPDNAVQHVYVIHYDLSAEEVRLQIGSEAESCLRDQGQE